MDGSKRADTHTNRKKWPIASSGNFRHDFHWNSLLLELTVEMRVSPIQVVKCLYFSPFPTNRIIITRSVVCKYVVISSEPFIFVVLEILSYSHTFPYPNSIHFSSDLLLLHNHRTFRWNEAETRVDLYWFFPLLSLSFSGSNNTYLQLRIN